jgi:hypothetical protein
MRSHIVAGLSVIISSQWYPVHQSVQALLDNCRDTNDPLQIRFESSVDFVFLGLILDAGLLGT